MKNIISALSIVAISGLSANAFAMDYPTQLQIEKMEKEAPKNISALLERSSSQESERHIVNIFDAGFGYKGYVIDDGIDYRIFYFDSTKKVLFSGFMVGDKMQDLSSNHYAKQIPQKDFTKTLNEIKKTKSYIIDGKDTAKKELFVFFDPNCAYCTMFWKSSRPLVENGDLKINWLPLAIFGKDSINKNATILQSEDPAKLLSDNEQNILKITEDENINDETKSILLKNFGFMKEIKSTGTPTILYETKDKKVHMISSNIDVKTLKTLIDKEVK